MKIEEIKINNYGILENKEIYLKNNLNIIYGKNESGKSTLLNYIKNIFYGISKNKNGKEISDYEKYLPWNEKEFSGRIKYKLDNGEKFEIFRDFKKKNPKVYNGNLEEISKNFNIDKKDGNQFFFEQTKVDENTFSSTVLTMQQEVRLNKANQNILVQRIANLAGSGDDNISYKKAVDKLNKKQLDEIGTERSQGKPINVVRKNLERTMVDLETIKTEKNNEEFYKEKIQKIQQEIDNNIVENNALNEINKLKKEIELKKEKNNIKNKLNIEKKEKIKELNLEKEKNIEKIKLNNLKKENKNKLINENNKKINKIFLILIILLILLEIINIIFLKNNIINYTTLSLIPIFLVIYFIIKNINNKKNIKNIEKNEETNLINKKIEEINTKINILKNEINEQEKEIEEENNKINIESNIHLELIKNKYNYNNENINNKINSDLNNIEYFIKLNQENINDKKIEKNKIEFELNNINKKIESMINLQEEYDQLQEELHILENKNKSIEIAKEALKNAYEEMKKNITPKFTQNLSNTINKISNGKYKKVAINDEEGLIVEIDNGEYIPAELFSVGTIDQLYLSLRLSMAQEISEEKMPIILDETFAYFDNERLENVLKYLINELKENQVILFTCTKREQEILNKLNIEYNLVEL